MKRRKSKKIFVPGTLITVRGTNCVFMSLGMKHSCELESFNGFDISTGHPVRRCDGGQASKQPASFLIIRKFLIHDSS